MSVKPGGGVQSISSLLCYTVLIELKGLLTFWADWGGIKLKGHPLFEWGCCFQLEWGKALLLCTVCFLVLFLLGLWPGADPFSKGSLEVLCLYYLSVSLVSFVAPTRWPITHDRMQHRPRCVFISRLVWYWAGTLLRINMLRTNSTVKPSTWILSIGLREV